LTLKVTGGLRNSGFFYFYGSVVQCYAGISKSLLGGCAKVHGITYGYKEYQQNTELKTIKRRRVEQCLISLISTTP